MATIKQYEQKQAKSFRQALADTRFVVLEKRYDESATMKQCWVMNIVYDTAGSRSDGQKDYVNNWMVGRGTATLEQADLMLEVLFPSATEYLFQELDVQTQRYITYNIAPMEWQDGLDAKDSALMRRFKIYADELPTIKEKK